jgi:hypothetical protein
MRVETNSSQEKSIALLFYPSRKVVGLTDAILYPCIPACLSRRRVNVHYRGRRPRTSLRVVSSGAISSKTIAASSNIPNSR